MRRPSVKQIEARNRNWTIRRLRGIYANSLSPAFTESEQRAILGAIDSALARLGAETETDRRARYRAGHTEPFSKRARGFARRAERFFVRSYDRVWS